MGETYFDIEGDEEERVIVLKGFFDAAAIVKLKNLFQSELEKGVKNFVIDFRKVQTVNSTAIGLLIASMRLIHQNEGKLRLRSLSHDVYRTFQIMGADRIFDIQT